MRDTDRDLAEGLSARLHDKRRVALTRLGGVARMTLLNLLRFPAARVTSAPHDRSRSQLDGTSDKGRGRGVRGNRRPRFYLVRHTTRQITPLFWVEYAFLKCEVGVGSPHEYRPGMYALVEIGRDAAIHPAKGTALQL